MSVIPDDHFIDFDEARARVAALRSERDALQKRVEAQLAELASRGAQIERLQKRVEELEGLRPEFPPMPPTGHGLPRYGLRWPPAAHQAPLAVPMPDGYWTPWHLAEAQLDAVAKERDERDAFAAAETAHANNWSIRAHAAEAREKRLREALEACSHALAGSASMYAEDALARIRAALADTATEGPKLAHHHEKLGAPCPACDAERKAP